MNARRESRLAEVDGESESLGRLLLGAEGLEEIKWPEGQTCRRPGDDLE